MTLLSYSRIGCVVLLASVVACGSPPDTVEVTETSMRSPYRPQVKLNASSEDRFQLAMRSQPSQMRDESAPPMTAQAPAEQPQLFAWDMPDGWYEVDPTPMRLINLRFGDASEVYLSLLPGTGGGITANVNRWRSQIGLDPISDAEVEELPRVKFFGRDAYFVDLQGAFSGMRDPEPKPGYRLVGALLEHGGRGIFVKMVGPQSELEGQAPEFESFLASIRLAETGPAAQATTSGTESPEGPRHAEADGIAWQTPPGWEAAPDRPMRLATYRVNDVECYITVLGPGGGGLLANLNRWLAQFGKEPLDELAVADLPSVQVLGQQAPMLEVTGDFTGMDGTTTTNQGLLAVASLLPEKSVFVKMTGPAEQVAEQRDAFIAFCESLHEH